MSEKEPQEYTPPFRVDLTGLAKKEQEMSNSTDDRLDSAIAAAGTAGAVLVESNVEVPPLDEA